MWMLMAFEDTFIFVLTCVHHLKRKIKNPHALYFFKHNFFFQKNVLCSIKAEQVLFFITGFWNKNFVNDSVFYLNLFILDYIERKFKIALYYTH